MRVLYCVGNLTRPFASGGHLRRWNVLQGLLQAGETDALVFRPRDAQIDERAFAGCDRVFPVDSRHVRPTERQEQLYHSTWGRGWLTLGSPYPFQLQLNNVQALRRVIRREIDFARYDLVWFATSAIAFAVGRLRGVPTVLDGDDFDYVREQHLLRSSPWYGAKVWNYANVLKLRWWETRFADRFSAVVRCSEEDRNRHWAPNIHVIPNGADVPQEIARRPERRLLFVGMLGYAPNLHGLEWFLSQVWPRVRNTAPDAALDIVGKGASAEIAARHGKDGIAVHGFVEDLTCLYRRAAASIVPLHAGAGTRLKIVESLARSTPVVSTTIGAFGIPAGQERGVFLADEAEEFAERCVWLLNGRHEAEEAAGAGREWVRDRYDWRTIRRQVADLARQMGERAGARSAAQVANS